MNVAEYLLTSEAAFAAMRRSASLGQVDSAADVVARALFRRSAVLVCGNGGSASDAMHISGELVGRFSRERQGANCICLSANPTVLTAWANDYDFETVFARQVEAHGGPGGVLIGLSTSGNSPNVIRAFEVANAMNMTTVAFTGQGGGKLAAFAEILIDVPVTSTPLVQQVHICLYHYMCDRVEEFLASGPAR